MRTAMITLDRLLPSSRVLCIDGGRFTRAPIKYLSVDRPGVLTHSIHFGAVGLGTATAIGTAVAARGDVTVGVVGDGGAMMGLIEFSTAVREKLPLVLVVLDDGSYGAEYTKLAGYGADPKYSLLDWPEFADVAQSLGGRGFTVRNLGELEALADELGHVDEPLLIDIKCDPKVDILAEHQAPDRC
jgi:thiamine pyrophosphate-dependent acetolactate synthase large subunit-like protein